MIVSLQWLKDYTDVNVDVKEFCDRMTMSGSNLETCTEVGTGISNVVVGKIEKIEPHPDADKLVICRVNVGDAESEKDENGLVQIVTGADNVFEGALVPVALHGSTVPGPLHGQPKQEGGVKIKKGKLRGVTSYGMLCGPQELGIEDKSAPMYCKDGIWILEGDYKLGEAIDKALDLKDYVIDFEITPNRPDCLSMLGMAREAVATFGTKMKYPEVGCENEVENIKDYIDVEVKSDLCKRYTARVIKDIKVANSPWWLQKCLIRAGMRPINNIVDITNFVMLEYGQPLHAFDIRDIEGAKIIVDTAKDGEKFITLDETERVLSSEMLMINDTKKPLAVAGVMGGLNSEIKPDTQTMVLEAANFNAASVRLTAKKLGIRSEASSRYEKGIDPNLCEEAADRFCYLIEKLGAGTVVSGDIDIYPKKEESKPVKARVSRINKVLGINIGRKQMEDYLVSLEMKVEGDNDNLIVYPPTVRQDINIEEVIIEEVARLYGYDNLPLSIPKGNNQAVEPWAKTLRDIARNSLCSMGADEIITYSFINPKKMDDLRIDEDSWERAFVKIKNPLGEDTSVLRTILTPGMLDVLSRNYNKNISEVKCFEIGNCFMKNLMDEKALPDESYSICIGTYGPDEDFFLLKGMVVELLSILGIDDLKFVAESEYGIYHPTRCARIIGIHELELEDGRIEREEIELGIMGEVHPEVCENFGIKTKAYMCELLYDNIVETSNYEHSYTPIPKYPDVTRDIALVVDEYMEVATIEKTIREAATDMLKKVEMFDVYRGKQVGDNLKSVAFNLIYRDDTKTLTDEEVNEVHEKILEELEKKLNAKLREM